MPITKYEGQTLKGQTFKLEECWFVNCVLEDCVFFYSGGSYELQNTRVEGTATQWKFQDEAARTFGLLGQLGLLKAQATTPPSATLNTGRVN